MKKREIRESVLGEMRKGRLREEEKKWEIVRKQYSDREKGKK